MVWRFDFVRKKTNIVNLDKEIIEMLEFYLDGTINNSTYRFQMFKKKDAQTWILPPTEPAGKPNATTNAHADH